MRLLPPLLATLLAAPLLVASVPVSADATTPTADPASNKSGRLVLLLDSSGSMKEAAAGGGTKIEAAKSALRDVVEQLPDSAEVGIRVFGAKGLSAGQPGACTDTKNVVPVGPLDRARLRNAVAGYTPKGETPIGNALKGAARDLGAAREGEKRTIVLLSDGEPTCAPDPCVVARKLRSQGIDLRINVVGLDVSGKARSGLQCVARAGGGRYFDASSSEELAESMVQVSVRALRLFGLTGKPVEGGTSTAAPAEIEPGDYVDESLPDEAPKFYLVDVPQGGAIAASAMMRPDSGEKILDFLNVKLLTPDGTECERDTTSDANVLGLQSILGSAAYYNPIAAGSSQEPCAEATQMLVQVDFNGAATPFGLRVRSYPKVTNLSTLPDPVDEDGRDSWEKPVPLQGVGTPVVGGASLDDAPELTPGTTYNDTLRPREQLIYKVKVEPGQSPRMSARLETDAQAAELQSIIGLQVQAGAFNAIGKKLGSTDNSATGARSNGRYNGDDPITLTSGHAPVRYRNIEPSDTDINSNSIAGYYYFTVEMGGDSDRSTERFQAPVRLAVAVDGQTEGAPEYDGKVQGLPAESPSPSATSPANADDATESSTTSDDESSVPWGVVAAGGGVFLVVLALVGGFLPGRRRRS